MNQLTIATGCSSYPGWYAPSSEVKQVFEKMTGFRRQKHTNIQASMYEYKHHYKIVIPLKNISKGDLVVMTHERRLVVVSKSKMAANIKGFRPLHGTSYFYGTVPLPGHVDAEFSCAEYRHGLLEVHLSKTNIQTEVCDHLILIY